jgi:hypothetical protein
MALSQKNGFLLCKNIVFSKATVSCKKLFLSNGNFPEQVQLLLHQVAAMI